MKPLTKESIPAFAPLKMARRSSVITLLFVALGILVGVAVSAYNLQIKSEEALRWKTQTHEVRLALASAQTHINQMVRAQRGFAIAGKDDWLDIYRKAKQDLPETLRRIKNLMFDSADQQRRLERMMDAVSDWTAFSEEVINAAQTRGLEAARQMIASGEGRDELHRIEQVLGEMSDVAERLLLEHETRANQISELAARITLFGSLLAIVLVAWVGYALQRTILMLRITSDKDAEQDWLKTHLAMFTRITQGQRDPVIVAELILAELAPLVNVQYGMFYSLDGEVHPPLFKLLATYAYQGRNNTIDASRSRSFHLGEGLVGQCAQDKKPTLLTQVPPNYIQISSGLGEAAPLNILLLPVVFDGHTKAVIELASFTPFGELHKTFMNQLAESLGIIWNVIEANARTDTLLKQSQLLTSQLQSQQQALRQSNEALEAKAAQLAMASKYKSEFLANMSHELRTPLNSLLLLARQLADNPEGNLTDKQRKFALTIHEAGDELLTLINDILDLSKIESGMVTLDLEDTLLAGLHHYVERNFQHVAEAKRLAFHIVSSPDLPLTIHTDVKRLQQVLKNLLANAFKFTLRGSVALGIMRVTEGWGTQNATLNSAEQVIAFAVSDTGVGIAPEKQQLIFEAFQQADGSTIRNYGGTGLGLSISRGIAKLLGGEITLHSKVGEGSTFTLYVPTAYSQPVHQEPFMLFRDSVLEKSALLSSSIQRIDNSANANRVLAHIEFPDDRTEIESGDRVLLIVEDDRSFSDILFDFAHQQGFKVLRTAQGGVALLLAREYRPDAIALALHLPDVNGWNVLDRLKKNPKTRHIPVHIISIEQQRMRGLQRGALDFITKPATAEVLNKALERIKEFLDRPIKQLLVVEDNENERDSIVEFIGNRDVKTTAVASVEEALTAMKQQEFDCLLLDLVFPNSSGLELLEYMRQQPEQRHIPVIIYTAKDLSPQEKERLHLLAEAVVFKERHSLERVLDKTALFLHRVTANLSDDKRRVVEKLYYADAALKGKKILVVDDDIRNIFALTSLLERFDVTVLTAENGKDALRTVRETPDLDAVLMDIMMPEMDGYMVTRAIRELPQCESLPIIALTANAMSGDREKCLEAGASDYIAKPVDMDKLLSALRACLYPATHPASDSLASNG